MNIQEQVPDGTVTKEEWVKHLLAHPIDAYQDERHDIQGAAFLEPVIDGYMTSPITTYKGNPISAISIVFADIGQTLEHLVNSGDRIILYMLSWYPGAPIYTEFNPQTFQPKPLAQPKFGPRGWKMRYAKV